MKNISFCLLLSLPFFFTGCSDDDDPARLGLEDPFFQEVPEAWISPYFQLNMQEIWNFYGINRNGTNYYFLPEPNEFSCSSRFIPSSEYFQSWVGIYTVEDNEEGIYAIETGELDAEEIMALAIADQKAWLTSFGLENPVVGIDESVQIMVENIVMDNINGWKLTGGLVSNVDVGDNNPQTGQALIDIEESFWNDLVASYQEVHLEVTAYVWYAPENRELNVAYFNLTEYQSKSGETIKNDIIRSELEQFVQSVTVYQP